MYKKTIKNKKIIKRGGVGRTFYFRNELVKHI